MLGNKLWGRGSVQRSFLSVFDASASACTPTIFETYFVTPQLDEHSLALRHCIADRSHSATLSLMEPSNGEFHQGCGKILLSWRKSSLIAFRVVYNEIPPPGAHYKRERERERVREREREFRTTTYMDLCLWCDTRNTHPCTHKSQFRHTKETSNIW